MIIAFASQHSMSHVVSVTATALGYSVICACSFALTLFYGDFSKFKTGPFYAIDFSFLVWLSLVFLSLPGRFYIRSNNLSVAPWLFKLGLTSLRNYCGPLVFVFLFFCYGSILTAYDLVSFSGQFALARVMQHAVLFVYPLIWTIVGLWIVYKYPLGVRWITFSVFIAGLIPMLYGRDTINMSIGPLTGVFCAYLLSKAKRPSHWVLVCAVAIATFYPFLKEWISPPLRRGPFFLLLSTLALSCIYFKSIKRLVVLIMIFVSILSLKIMLTPQPLSTQLYASFEHGEDSPQGSPSHFQFRARKFWWKGTVEEWKKHPIVGIGMIPEVPPYVMPGWPNNGNFKGLPHYELFSSPLAGPHNSYLAILARMGLIGLFIFLCILVLFIKSSYLIFTQPERSLHKLLLVIVPLNGFLYATANVGLDSPHNCMVLWLFVGMLAGFLKHSNYRSAKKRISFC